MWVHFVLSLCVGDLWMRTAADRPSASQAALSSGVTETRGFSPPHRNPSWAHTLASGVTDGIQPPPEEGCSSADGLTARRESTHAPIPTHTHTHARTACITPEHTAFTKHTCTLFCQHVFPAYTRRDTHTHPHPYPHTHTGWVYPFINKDESQFPLLSC